MKKDVGVEKFSILVFQVVVFYWFLFFVVCKKLSKKKKVLIGWVIQIVKLLFSVGAFLEKTNRAL